MHLRMPTRLRTGRLQSVKGANCHCILMQTPRPFPMVISSRVVYFIQNQLYIFTMFENHKPQPLAETLQPSAIVELYTRLRNRPDNHGIRGQVQIQVLSATSEDVMYQESALYEVRLEKDSNGEERLYIKAANQEGVIREYRSVDDEGKRFVATDEEDEHELTVNFPS